MLIALAISWRRPQKSFAKSAYKEVMADDNNATHYTYVQAKLRHNKSNALSFPASARSPESAVDRKCLCNVLPAWIAVIRA